MTPTQTFILAMLSALLAALVTGVPATIIAWKNSKKADIANEKADIANEKNDLIIEKTNIIHDLTNSNLTKVKEELALAHASIQSLQELVADITKFQPILPEKKP